MTLKQRGHTERMEMMMVGGSHVESVSLMPQNLTAGNTHTHTCMHEQAHKPLLQHLLSRLEPTGSHVILPTQMRQ